MQRNPSAPATLLFAISVDWYLRKNEMLSSADQRAALRILSEFMARDENREQFLHLNEGVESDEDADGIQIAWLKNKLSQVNVFYHWIADAVNTPNCLLELEQSIKRIVSLEDQKVDEEEEKIEELCRRWSPFGKILCTVITWIQKEQYITILSCEENLRKAFNEESILVKQKSISEDLFSPINAVKELEAIFKMANLLSTREDQGKYFALYGASVSLQHRIGNDAAALRALRNVEDKMNKEGNPACIAVLQWWKAILGEERFEESYKSSKISLSRTQEVLSAIECAFRCQKENNFQLMWKWIEKAFFTNLPPGHRCGRGIFATLALALSVLFSELECDAAALFWAEAARDEVYAIARPEEAFDCFDVKWQTQASKDVWQRIVQQHGRALIANAKEKLFPRLYPTEFKHLLHGAQDGEFASFVQRLASLLHLQCGEEHTKQQRADIAAAATALSAKGTSEKRLTQHLCVLMRMRKDAKVREDFALLLEILPYITQILERLHLDALVQDARREWEELLTHSV